MTNSLANINVRLGFIFDQKSLAAVEKSLQRTGDRLARTGQNISLFISAPLAAIGVSAIKAAGEFESLSLSMQATFKNAGRTVAEANAEVEALRKAALAPGLDFPQAVAASIRLQSVGLSAEKARDTIQELANAVASTGGTAIQLESVTVQMAQMISKGKVLSGDLRIIQENLPIISDLMLKAFGTSNAEKIQELGITGKEFVSKITVEMGKLTRVSGGISNAIVNAGSAVNQALAGIGEEIARVFDIKGLSESFSSALHSMTEGFKGLSDGTKKVIVYVAAFLVALGPISLVMGGIVSVASTLVGVYRTAIAPISQFIAGHQAVAKAVQIATAQEILATKALETSKAATILATSVQAEAVGAKKSAAAATALLKAREIEAAAASSLLAAQTQVTTATTAASATGFQRASAAIAGGFKAMDLASKAFLAIGIAFAIYQIADSLGAFGKAVTASEHAQKALNDVQKEAVSAIAGEKSAVDVLIATINSEVSSREAKERAIEKLKAISPAYFGQLKVENGLVNGLTASYDAYVKSLLNSARAEAAKGKLVEIERELLDIEDQRAAKLAEGQKVAAAYGVSAASVAEREAAAYNKQLEVLTAKKNVLTGVVIQSESANASTVKNTEATTTNTAATETNTKTKQGQTAAVTAAKKAEEDYLFLVESEIRFQDRINENLKEEIDNREKIKQIKKDNPNFDQLPAANALPANVPTGITDVQQAIFDSEPLSLAAERVEYLRLKMSELRAAAADTSATFDIAAEGITSIAGVIGSALEGTIPTWKEFAGSALKAIADVIGALVKLAVTTAFAGALKLSSFLGPLAVPIAAAAGALAASALKGLIGIAGFAKGTRDAPGGLAIVGERGPELVNLPRHSQVFPNHVSQSMMSGGGVGGMHLSGEFVVRGTDLVLTLDRVQQKQSRYQ